MAENVQKSVMHVQSCCFTNINLLLFLPLSLRSLLSLPNVPFVVIQKFCYHGNLTSHFSSLFRQVNSSGESRPSYKGGGGGEGGGGGGHPDPEIRRGRFFFFNFGPSGLSSL